jgi:hypothetical protein
MWWSAFWRIACVKESIQVAALSGHIGQGHNVQETHRPRDASSKGRVDQGTHRTSTYCPSDGTSKTFHSQCNMVNAAINCANNDFIPH